MKLNRIPQEGLKLIACITMLIDHIGAVLLPSWIWLRVIGRLSFPIYCFLLAEGAAHTKNAGRYALRLLLCALISEPIYDLVFYGRITFAHQSIMLSLLLGFCMLWLMKRFPNRLIQAAILLVAGALARLLCLSYGWRGILVIAIFWMTRGVSFGWLLQLAGIGIIFWNRGGTAVPVLSIGIPLQLFGVLALLPVWLYSGRKLTKNKAVQWAFYAFYPVHLLILYLI